MAFAICRRDVAQCRRVCADGSFDTAMIPMASAKEVSIKVGMGFIGISSTMSDADGD
jgi:hypothetical protein